MYYCRDCGFEFEAPEIITETHGLSAPPYERDLCCPRCKGRRFREKVGGYCRCCGAKLTGQTDYCSEKCRAKGEAMWRRELKRRSRSLSDPLNKIVRETDDYNRENGTRYSYGQYVALVRPRLKGKKRR